MDNDNPEFQRLRDVAKAARMTTADIGDSELPNGVQRLDGKMPNAPIPDAPGLK